MKKRDTYLAMALTTYCNYQCFYCKEGGESISKKKETIPFSKIKSIISNAYDIGIKNFRITGGEPTTVDYFGELITYIMSFNDTKIRINTNGYKILDYINILSKYRERIDIVFSVDSISEYLNGVHFQKFLSEDVIKTTKILKNQKIPIRYNIVVTSLNKQEVEPLILKAVDDLKINVKLLDLNKFSEYLGYSCIVSEEGSFNFWKKHYVPMNNFYDFLEKISDSSNSEWTTNLIQKGHGIPMSAYFRGENWIQVKDSTRGAKYSDFCIEECIFYKTGNCQEGVFSLFLSSNLMLHLSGCKNSSIYFDLSNSDDEEVKTSFTKLLSLI